MGLAHRQPRLTFGLVGGDNTCRGPRRSCVTAANAQKSPARGSPAITIVRAGHRMNFQRA